MADAPAAGGAAPGTKGKVENSVLQLLLSLIPGYVIYWMWLRAKELNDYLGKQAINSMLIFPGCCLCIPLYIGDWFMGKAVAEAEQKAGTSQKDDSLIYFLLLLFLYPVGVWMVQEKLNAVWKK